MNSKVKLKEVYEVQTQYKAFYTGGTVAWTPDGQQFLCLNNGTISIVSVDNQQEPATLGEVQTDEEINEDVIYTFAIAATGNSVVSAHRSGLLKLWDREARQQLKMWKAIHQGPIATLVFSPDDSLVASGGSDTTIRVWDPSRQLCLGTLRGCTGVVNLIVFHPDAESKTVVAAGDDERIHAWNYETRERTKTFAGHFSRVTGVSFSTDRRFLVSSGRDKILILWNYETQEAIKTIPVYEALETVTVLPAGVTVGGCKLSSDNGVYAACGGEEGIIKVWEMTETKIVYKQSNSLVTRATEEGGLSITHLIYSNTLGQMAIVSADHNLLVHDCASFECVRQLAGFSDEILDIVLLGKNDRYLAMATNSNDFKIYDTTTMNCQLVKGHTDIVLSLSANQRYLVSSSKDNSIRLWQFDEEQFTIKCLAVGLKHTSAVGSVAISGSSAPFCASVSQDRCLKTWKIPKRFEQGTDTEELPRIQCNLTQLAHEKDINCVCIAPNDRLLATASQDKTAKLWDVSDLSVVGVLRGHRRGIWAVRFSPVDQILLTNAADCSIKLWSLTDMSCLKTLEGHDSSVLRVEFISGGMQLLSAGADGLLKLWSIKSSECLETMDKHDSRIWALCVTRDESTFFSGGSDSQLIKWHDVTDAKREQAMNARKEVLLQEQELNNLLSEKKLLKALRLSLNLDRPLSTLKIVNEVIKSQETGLEETIRKLSNDHKETLLRHAIEWNTNSKNARPAQLVLHTLLQEVLAGRFQVSELNKHLEASLPYTERHFKRLTEYMKDLKFVEYSLRCMQPHASRTE
ncbi:transducin beta-like protein 3 [Anopheles darlingi]|uniref:transducin beta-like protein 3 n=1 Tax=Anopheles darlingi TaxID=43151 RepID=UPI00210042A5|nr:transducin beta-like protein 3 [Anopheles darlingi]